MHQAEAYLYSDWVEENEKLAKSSQHNKGIAS